MKQFELKKLLDSKKFNVTVISINFSLIVILLVILAFMHFKTGDTEKSVQNIGDINVESLINEADAGMPDVYRALLENSDFDLGNDIEFHFGEDGVYAGYFDADNKNVSDYHYIIAPDKEGNYTLTISNDDKSKYVEYSMSFDADGNILLNYPGMDQSLVLKY